MILETAAVLSAAKPFINSIVEKLITPKIEEFADWCKTKHKELMIPNAEHFQEYLERSYDKYSIINTLVFHNSQRHLKDIYVAQTLVKENRFEDDEKSIQIDKLPVNLIKEFKKILITDTAGMGKSTILKRMFVDLIDNSLVDVGIPIYIELNRLNKDRSIITEIQEELDSLSEKFDNDLLLKFIQTGGFIFFLDGYDEISIKDRNEVTIDVHTFISKAGNKNYYILTSRPESGLASFGDFQSFKIQPLTKNEAYELLEKYDLSKKKELSRKLVELLKSGQYNTIDEYLVNPLLVSLLFTAYDYNRSIPFEKHRFYGLVFEAYFEKHDSSKPIKARIKYSGLNLDGFDSILRYVGYKCLTTIGVKFDEDSILNIIRAAKEHQGHLDFSESDFLKDLVSSVPLFCKEGTDYKWVHKSLLEYFAARFIYCDAKQKQDVILTRIFNSDHVEKYINMLDLYYDIDNLGFIKNIESPLLQDYISFYNENMIQLSNISKQLIEERVGYLYGQDIYFETTSHRNNNYKDFFNRVKNGFKTNNMRLDFMTITDKFITGHIILPHRKLLDLLVTKKQDLFVEPNFQPWDNNIERQDLRILDMHTGKKNEKTYKDINNIIIFSSDKSTSGYLCYEKCRKEVERINVLIKNNEDESTLLDGL